MSSDYHAAFLKNKMLAFYFIWLLSGPRIWTYTYALLFSFCHLSAVAWDFLLTMFSSSSCTKHLVAGLWNGEGQHYLTQQVSSALRFNKVIQTLSKRAMHKVLMQFQINYLQQCSFWHPVVLWLSFFGLISSKSFPVVCVPARMEHTRMWFCYMLFTALSLSFLLLKLSLHWFCLNNTVFLFLPEHWFPLLFLAYNSLLCSVWYL